MRFLIYLLPLSLWANPFMDIVNKKNVHLTLVVNDLEAIKALHFFKHHGRVYAPDGRNELLNFASSHLPSPSTYSIYLAHDHHYLIELSKTRKGCFVYIPPFQASPELQKHFKEEIKVLFTSAVFPRHFARRKWEYTESLYRLYAMGYYPFIVEACSNSRTFLDDLCNNVFRSRVNSPKIKNIGVNETNSLIAALEHYRFKDDDMILKLTGRYRFTNDAFLKYIREHFDADAIVNYDPSGQVRTGCMALKGNHMNRMLRGFNLNFMEKNRINMELAAAWYVKRVKNKRAVDRINLTGHVYGHGFFDPFTW